MDAGHQDLGAAQIVIHPAMVKAFKNTNNLIRDVYQCLSGQPIWSHFLVQAQSNAVEPSGQVCCRDQDKGRSFSEGPSCTGLSSRPSQPCTGETLL